MNWLMRLHNVSDYASDYNSDIDEEEAIFNHISNY